MRQDMNDSPQTALSPMQRIYQSGVLVFAFSLPTLEALKHLGFIMMCLGFAGMTWSGNGIRKQKPTAMEWVLAGLVITSTISTCLNWPLVEGIKGLKHVCYHLTTLWILYRTRHTHEFLTQIAVALVAGTLAGIGWEMISLVVNGPPPSPTGEYEMKFHSINSVSRSGAYNATIVFTCISVLIQTRCPLSQKHLIFFVLSFLILFACVLVMGGRGNVLGLFAAFLILFTFIYKNKRYKHFIKTHLTLAIMVIAGVFVLGGTPQFGRVQHLLSTKFTTNVENMALQDQMRLDYWRIGLAKATHPLSIFGVGPRNFKSVDIHHLSLSPPLLPDTLELIGEAPRHAHNWLLTKWVEDGTAGLLLFLVLLGLICHALWRTRPSPAGEKFSWIWMATLGAMVIAVISGLFNSAFTHENGWLTFFIMGLGAGHTAFQEPMESPAC